MELTGSRANDEAAAFYGKSYVRLDASTWCVSVTVKSVPVSESESLSLASRVRCPATQASNTHFLSSAPVTRHSVLHASQPASEHLSPTVVETPPTQLPLRILHKHSPHVAMAPLTLAGSCLSTTSQPTIHHVLAHGRHRRHQAGGHLPR